MTSLAMSVPEAGHRFYGLGRDASYAAAQRGEIPTVTVGRRLIVPVHAVLKQQGASDELIALILRGEATPDSSEAGSATDPAIALDSAHANKQEHSDGATPHSPAPAVRRLHG